VTQRLSRLPLVVHTPQATKPVAASGFKAIGRSGDPGAQAARRRGSDRAQLRHQTIWIPASSSPLPPVSLPFRASSCIHPRAQTSSPRLHEFIAGIEPYYLLMSERPSPPSSSHLEPPSKSVELEDPGAPDYGKTFLSRSMTF
jgi:hypothetical protein